MAWHGNSKNYSVSKDIVFKEALDAINTLRIRMEKSDEPNGIIEAEVGGLIVGNWIKITITPLKEGSSVYVESHTMGLSSYLRGEENDYDQLLNKVDEEIDEENVNKIFAELDRRISSLGYMPASQPSVSPSPTPPPPPLAPVAQTCPTCGRPLTFIQQYSRWYCYNCKKYP